MTSILKIKKKPVVVEALQWTGNNIGELEDFGAELRWSRRWSDRQLQVWVAPESSWVAVPLNHYIIKGVRGEYYPIADDILAETYDVVEG